VCQDRVKVMVTGSNKRQTDRPTRNPDAYIHQTATLILRAFNVFTYSISAGSHRPVLRGCSVKCFVNMERGSDDPILGEEVGKLKL